MRELCDNQPNWIGRRPRALAAAVALSVLVCGPLAAEAPARIDAEWQKKWAEDLEFARQELPKAHANLFHSLSAEEFNAAIDDLKRRLPSLMHPQVIVELAEIVALVGDGHTRLALPMVPGRGFFQGHSLTPLPAERAMLFRDYPLRLYDFDEGLFIRRVTPKHAWAAGAEVVSINGRPIAEVVELVTPMIQRDNASQVRHLLPQRLVVPEILQALAVVDGSAEARFELRTASGETRTLALEPVPIDEEVLAAHRAATGEDGGPAFARSETAVEEEVAALSWVDAYDGELPLYLQRRETNYWMQYLPEKRSLYVQYNECYDEGEETIAQFAERLLSKADGGDVDRVILDLRHNVGGNNGNNRPLLHAFIRSSTARERDGFFVITGRRTFSAAVMLAVDLEEHTPALFVGEPTGGSPNGYGDSRKLKLPNSGLTVRASTLHWQYSDPRDERDAIAPHVEAPPTIASYQAGLDPALDAILGRVGLEIADADFAGEWRGRVETTPLIIRLVNDAGEWSGSLDLPEYGIADHPMQDVSVEGGRLLATVIMEGSEIRVEGSVEDGLMLGTARGEDGVQEFVLLPPS